MHLRNWYIVNTFNLPGHPHGMREVCPMAVPSPRRFHAGKLEVHSPGSQRHPVFLASRSGTEDLVRQPCSHPSFGTSKLEDLEESLKPSKPLFLHPKMERVLGRYSGKGTDLQGSGDE